MKRAKADDWLTYDYEFFTVSKLSDARKFSKVQPHEWVKEYKRPSGFIAYRDETKVSDYFSYYFS